MVRGVCVGGMGFEGAVEGAVEGSRFLFHCEDDMGFVRELMERRDASRRG